MNIYLDYRSNEYAHLSPECYCGGVAPAAAACGVAYLRYRLQKETMSHTDEFVRKIKQEQKTIC